jgi:2-haloacid dehalogenase
LTVTGAAADLARQPPAGPVSAVVFDVGRVLFDWDLRCLFAKLIADADELEWFVTHVVSEAWHHQHDEGRPLGDMVAERTTQFPDHAQLIQAYATRFNETVPGPVAGSLEVVRALHARGVPLFAITNFAEAFWPAFRAAQPVFDCFSDIVVSGVEKVAKPDPRIYDIAADRFGHAPGAMLFIDDKLENIAAARALGWQGHHFCAAPHLVDDLAGRGLI